MATIRQSRAFTTVIAISLLTWALWPTGTCGGKAQGGSIVKQAPTRPTKPGAQDREGRTLGEDFAKDFGVSIMLKVWDCLSNTYGIGVCIGLVVLGVILFLIYKYYKKCKNSQREVIPESMEISPCSTVIDMSNGLISNEGTGEAENLLINGKGKESTDKANVKATSDKGKIEVIVQKK